MDFRVTPEELFQTIGSQTVELNLARAEIAKLTEANRSLQQRIQQLETTAVRSSISEDETSA